MSFNLHGRDFLKESDFSREEIQICWRWHENSKALTTRGPSKPGSAGGRSP